MSFDKIIQDIADKQIEKALKDVELKDGKDGKDGVVNYKLVDEKISKALIPINKKYDEMLVVLNQLKEQIAGGGGSEPTPEPQPIKAFPTAEGFGKNAIGGRGGRVIFVTNLNDSGPGSFREACEASGPRNVVFLVGGRINMLTTIHITNPFITIWGQSAPGDGICLSTDFPVNIKTLGIVTHEVIIRYIKFRRSITKAASGGDADCLWIGSGYNIIVDHCSLAWSSDGNLDISNYVEQGGGTVESNSTRNITISNCMFGPNLGAATKTMLVARSTKVTFLGNFFINSRTRNPAFNNPVDDGVKFDQYYELANNYYYDYLNAVTYDCNDPAADNGMMNIVLLNNRALKYTTTTGSKVPMIYPNNSLIINWRRAMAVSPIANLKLKVYAKGNITPWRHNDSLDEYSFIQYGAALPDDNDKDLPAQYISETPIMTPLLDDNVTLLPANDVFDALKETVGASFPTRDAEDIRMINDAENGLKTITIDFVPTMPTYASGTPPIDSNNDGIPDDWTASNMPSGVSYNDISPSGYPWIEVYFNSLTN